MEDPRPFTVSATGPRALPEPERHGPVVAGVLRAQAALHPDLRLVLGMAEGWDELVARQAVALGLPWVAVVPDPGYGERAWGAESPSGRDRVSEYRALLDLAGDVVVVCPGASRAGLPSTFARNRYLVAQADLFLVYEDPASPGTRDCLERIHEAGTATMVLGRAVAARHGDDPDAPPSGRRDEAGPGEEPAPPHTR